MMYLAEGIKFDPTISFGAILSMLGIVMAIMGSAWKMLGKIEKAQADVADVKGDVAEMKPQVAQILVLQQQTTEHDRRMTRLEDAVFTKK